MTKQEVQAKIKQYERQISQYQSEIRNLNNRISACNNEIRRFENEIVLLNNQKSIADGELGELVRLKGKLEILQTNFASRQQKRLSGFNKGTGVLSGVKFITTYMSGMRELLSGKEYTGAYNGLSEAIEKVNKQIKEKKAQQERIQNDLNTNKRKVDSRKSEINSARATINQRNSDINYCKNRIRYWQEQMASAT